MNNKETLEKRADCIGNMMQLIYLRTGIDIKLTLLLLLN